MSNFDCRYCKVPNTGELVYYNKYPEYVDKMYDLKSAIAELATSCYILDEFVAELEQKLFEDDGRGFLVWIRHERVLIRADICFIIANIGDRNDTEEVWKLKNRIIKLLEEFMV